jgi:phosphoribosylformylglycinamidine (FGAM) synthase-like enzyme
MLSLLQKYSLDFEIIGKTDIKRLEISNCGFTLVDLPLRVVYDKYKRGMKDKLR